jgi:hypothetical protein
MPTGHIPCVRKVPRALQDFLPHSLSKLSQPLRALAVIPQEPVPTTVAEGTAPAPPSTSPDTSSSLGTPT